MRYAPLEVHEPEVTPHESRERSRSEDWKLAQRVVASAGFRKSVLLTNFLLYVCDRKLRGREDEITEYQIGTQALGRSAAYNPGDDNIVRNYARILRQRLDDYFAAEGAGEATRIVIPRGSYVPAFEKHAVAVVAPAERLVLIEPAGAKDEAVPPRRARWWPIALAAVVLLASVAGAIVGWRWHRDSPGYLAHQFWGQMFDPQRSTFVVPADSGLAMLQDLTGQEVHLHEYVTDSLQQSFKDLDVSQHRQAGAFGADRFSNLSSTADLSIVLALAGLPEFVKGHAIVHYARDIRMDDLKHSNMIFLGGPHANPWLELFDPIVDFRIVFPPNLPGRHLDEKSIVNLHPRPGERAVYANVWNAQSHETYAIMSFLPSIDHAGYALLLEGQNMGGTEAAADFVLDPVAMAPILRKALLPDGSIGEFQILLQTRTVGANAPEAHPVVERYGTQ